MIQPPHIFLRFFRWFCRPELKDAIEGDLIELYRESRLQHGKRKADIKFAGDVALLFRPGIIRSFKETNRLNFTDMLANYFKIAFRILVRNKGYSFINISGLAIGMAAAILIMLWVQNEISYDRFHPNAERTYKMFSRDNNNGRLDVWGNTSALIAPELKQSYAEVEDAVRHRRVFFLVKAGQERFNEMGAFTDPGFFSMFDFKLLTGNKSALVNDFGIVLSKKLAIKLFGSVDCIGKTVIVNDTDNFSVTGVLNTLPANTEFDFEYLLPWNYMTRLGWDNGQTWANTNTQTFVTLKTGSSFDLFDSKIRSIVKSHIPKGDGSTREVLTHPLTKVHLYSNAENGELTRGRIETVELFIVIAGLVLLIACINFMNLMTARSEKRAQEVGVRKIVGALKRSLVTQFISESTLLTVIAFVMSLALVQLALGAFNQIVNTQLHLPYDNLQFWMYALALILLTGLLAGSYPAFFLSSSKPIKVLKGTFHKVNALVTPRKVLVVMQFTFAIVLSLCALMVQRQIQFAQDRDAGYNKSNVAYNFMQGEIPIHFESIKNELIASGAAVSVTRTFSPVISIWSFASELSWQGSDESDKKINFLQYGADADLARTFGMQVKLGRDLDIKTFPSDTTAVLLNEAAVDIMRLKDPIGETIKDNTGTTWHVVGVVKDFIVQSPYDRINPMIINGWTERYGVLNFKLNPANDQATNLALAEKVFKKYNPEYPFEYFFAEDFYNRKFGNERQTATLAASFAGLTIFISCLGLFGLAAYMAESRTKEIGVRKVLGASTLRITTLLSIDFVKLVFIAILFASPLAWFVINNWLQSFNYRVSVGVGIFIQTGIVAIVVALATVIFQAVKAATANPISSLKSE
ncbi:ABC transporter permease [Cytophagales bacterium WSM2-2]|nr:ABC transporter permease [Cytophagales bacterium WSM2-2]